MNESAIKKFTAKVSHIPALLLLIALPYTAFLGCGRAINRSAERRIRDMLPNLVGSAREYKVHVEGAETDTARGRIQSIRVDGQDVNLSNGLLLDNLHLEMRKIVADLDRRQIRSVESASFTAAIGENTLDEYFAGESPEGETLRDIHIAIHEGTVTIAGQRVVLGVGVPFKAYGPLKLIGPQQIELDPNKLVVIGIPITGAPLRFLKKKFESAMDLSSLPVPMRLDSVTMHNHRLVLTGTPDVPAILRLRRDEGVIK